MYVQIRSKIIFGVQTTQLKLVSHMYDICQDVLVQFTEFLMQGGVTLSGSASEKVKVFEGLAGNNESLLRNRGNSPPLHYLTLSLSYLVSL